MSIFNSVIRTLTYISLSTGKRKVCWISIVMALMTISMVLTFVVSLVRG